MELIETKWVNVVKDPIATYMDIVIYIDLRMSSSTEFINSEIANEVSNMLKCDCVYNPGSIVYFSFKIKDQKNQKFTIDINIKIIN